MAVLEVASTWKRSRMYYPDFPYLKVHSCPAVKRVGGRLRRAAQAFHFAVASPANDRPGA
jgi:hypothetical protein